MSKPIMHKGRLTVWKDERGFGFIKPSDGGRDVFLHISALKKANRRPKVGDVIQYQLTVDNNGKVCASNAVIEEVASQSELISSSLVLKGLLLSLFPLWGSISFAITTSNLIPLIVYPAMSLLTFVLYADDKSRAIKGQWRRPEAMLHLCELIGGWLGAFIAQQKLRHKSRKVSYQIVFWVIVSAHIVIWVDWLFIGGTLINQFLISISRG
ncbi:MAG TPA: cold shock and DUF1294 domain-containing protein [Leptolyngbyaceae cyanobacterium]